MATIHEHAAIESRDVGFTGPVNNDERNEAADGNITRIERCACGAERRTNINQRHVESGEWSVECSARSEGRICRMELDHDGNHRYSPTAESESRRADALAAESR